MKAKDQEKPQRQLVAKAEKALKEAVAKTIEDHFRSGDPIVVWKNGKVVEVSPETLCAPEARAGYRAKKTSRPR
jgi:hypothetical protein